MRNTRTFIGSTLAAVLALAGCDAQSFASINSSLTQFKAATSRVGSPAVPAATIAATLGGVELARAIADKSASLIAAGGGNLIAAGGGNYELLAEETLDFSTAAGLNGVSEATAKIDSEPVSGRKQKTAIKSFSCKSQGYLISGEGTFEYTAAEVSPENAYVLFQTGAKGNLKCSMTGKVEYNKSVVVNLKKLEISTIDPLPKTGLHNIAKLEMETPPNADEYVLIQGEVQLRENVLEVKAKSKVGKNGTLRDIEFNQNNVGGVSAAADGQSVSTETNKNP